MDEMPKRVIEAPQAELDDPPATDSDSGKINQPKPRAKAGTVKERKLKYSFWIAIGCLISIMFIFIIQYFFPAQNETNSMTTSVTDIFKTAMLLAMGYLFGNINKSDT